MKDSKKIPVTNPNNYHEDIPGNPSTATSSKIKLNDRSNGVPLRVLTDQDWDFWINNGYIVVKKCGESQAGRGDSPIYMGV